MNNGTLFTLLLYVTCAILNTNKAQLVLKQQLNNLILKIKSKTHGKRLRKKKPNLLAGLAHVLFGAVVYIKSDENS